VEHATVSVVIPCYGQAHFLREAIESVIAQSHPAEIVVVDDGSPDNTAEVAARYPQVRYVRQDNKGLAEARNSGFRVASGEYVMFLDADDRLTPNALEAHLNCFAEHPEAQLVVGAIDHIAEDGSYLRSPRWPLLQANFYEELLKVNHVANMIAVMARREVVASVGGFEPSCSPAEDYRLLLRAVRRFASAHHRSVVAQYRRYPASLSRRGAVMLRALDRVMELEKPLVEGDPRLESARRQGIRYWRDHYGRIGLREVYDRFTQGALISALGTLGTLIWYGRTRLLILPWTSRRRILRNIQARLVGAKKLPSLK
jgi:glycosyltransferase involved in cell wall biosynthesis